VLNPEEVRKYLLSDPRKEAETTSAAPNNPD
jgi:hypothetical protein